MIKDGVEDYRRHKADALENRRTVARLVVNGDSRNRRKSSFLGRPAAAVGPTETGVGLKEGLNKDGPRQQTSGGRDESTPPPQNIRETISWLDVRVGDVLEVKNRESFPADLALLSCSDPRGTCFVMTSNLDGETNLKPRIVSPDLRAAMQGAGENEGASALAERRAVVECSLPNQKLEHFDGAVAVSGRGLI